MDKNEFKNGGYSNQGKNDGHLIEYNGEKHTLKEWSEISGINYSTLKRRINKDNVDIKTALLPSKDYRKRER